MEEIKRVAVRIVDEPSPYSGKKVRSAEEAVQVIGEDIASYHREVICVTNLSTKGEIQSMSIVSMGTINSALLEPREVFICAILSNAASVILLHNHPSGEVIPSEEDKLVTQRLIRCGELLGIPVLDHVIVGAGGKQWYSFKEEGLMEALPEERLPQPEKPDMARRI